jgi:predicted Na+-dependent transporter
MRNLNGFIRHNIGIFLLLSAAGGLIIPELRIHTSILIIPSLAVILFASYFKITFNRELITNDIVIIAGYVFARFLILPVVLFFSISGISSFYAISFFLLLILPSAVSAPAFTGIFNGNTVLSLKIVVITSFLAIFSIPLLCRLVLSDSIELDITQLFLLMVYTIVIPFIVHLPLRRYRSLSNGITTNSPLITASGLSLIFIISTSKNRELILSQPLDMLLFASVSVGVYLLLYLTGFFFYSRKENPDRITYDVCSGANNIGIGVSLTTIFFPGKINVFFVVAQLAWVFVLIPIRYFFRNSDSNPTFRAGHSS